jgi:hypothetical protein
MGIDIRLPLGILFFLLGLILVIYGIAGDPSRYQRSLGINVNLYWGFVLLAFGVLMLVLGRRGAKRLAGGEPADRLPRTGH